MNLNNYQFYKIEEKFSDIDDNDDNFIKIDNKWINDQSWPLDLQKFEFKKFVLEEDIILDSNIDLYFKFSKIKNSHITFDGNGFKIIISNIINYNGLFQFPGENYYFNFTVQNCGVISEESNLSDQRGWLIGVPPKASHTVNIKNCYSEGIVPKYGGGLVGAGASIGSYTNIYNSYHISESLSDYAGGIVGMGCGNGSYRGRHQGCYISNCFSIIRNIGCYSAGILGYYANGSSNTVNNCFSIGNITCEEEVKGEYIFNGPKINIRNDRGVIVYKPPVVKNSGGSSNLEELNNISKKYLVNSLLFEPMPSIKDPIDSSVFVLIKNNIFIIYEYKKLNDDDLKYLIGEDCIGHFTKCDKNCEKEWIIDKPTVGNGLCFFKENNKYKCQFGEGECEESKDCIGEWSKCNDDCVKTWKLVTKEQGEFGKCDFFDGQQKICNFGEDECKESKNCTGEWTKCNNDCTKKWNLKTKEEGKNGICNFINGEEKMCEEGEDKCVVSKDCTGEWSECDKECNKKWKLLTKEQGKYGTCNFVDGQLDKCEEGEGNCLVSKKCTGKWSECDINCTSKWELQTKKQGIYGSCEFTNGQIKKCKEGEGKCLPSKNCIGKWTECNNDCTKKWVLEKKSQGIRGTCQFINGANKKCEEGEGKCKVSKDCVGEWSECDKDCIKKWKLITKEQGKNGSCLFIDGQSQKCNEGNGKCVISKDCVGEWSKCDKTCTSKWNLISKEQGEYGKCEFVDGQEKKCDEGIDECLLSKDCTGEWSECNENCTSSWKKLTNEQGKNGKCEFVDRQKKKCDEGIDKCQISKKCTGKWSECNENCISSWNLITADQGKNGYCDFIDGQQKRCNEGEDKCIVSKNCKGEWSECNSDCISKWNLIEKQQGKYGTCDFINNQERQCQEGEGKCLISKNCTGEWSKCNNKCISNWKILTKEQGKYGRCNIDNDLEKKCTDGEGECSNNFNTLYYKYIILIIIAVLIFGYFIYKFFSNVDIKEIILEKEISTVSENTI